MKNLLFLLLLLSSFIMKAQPTNKPVKCSFELKKTGDHQYQLQVALQIEEHWHLFTPDPGGDGFLIPTSVSFSVPQDLKHPEKLTVASKITTKDIKEIGVVNYVEGKALFTMPLTLTGSKTLSGLFSYQCCNDSMCLPPVDEPFTLEIKE